MIYFDKPMREHVHGLFYESLVNLGVLGLGRKETARFTAYEDRYEELDPDERLYRKVA
jgi:chemotaxis protein methyltransferase CheR